MARFGGDEFVVLIEALGHDACEASSQTEVIAQKMRVSIGRTFNLNGHAYTTSISIGFVIFLGDQDPINIVLKKADMAMYRAKLDGRNTVRVFDDAMQMELRTHNALTNDMRRGLELQEFMLFYQVQVNVLGAPTGAEALMRWKHPHRGLMVASRFIPLAEETCMILTLGQWVLETACQQLRAWEKNQKTEHWTMAINVSDCQFAKTDFVTHVTSALQKTGANPHRLMLELTESILKNDVQDVIVKMNALKGLGVRFSVDDFGTGLSSLAHLRQLPLDQLKIAPSFVRRMLTDDSDAVIVRAIVALGHSLGLEVIAVAVENAQQRERLADMGCTAFQGDYFGSAQQAGDLVEILMVKQVVELTGIA